MSATPAAALRAEPPPGLFARLRIRLFLNHFATLLAKSRLRLTLIVLLSGIIWFGLYYLFAEGIRFIRALGFSEPDMPEAFTFFEMLFGTFFTALIGLMVFSNGLLLYASLFRSAETRFLLTTPASARRIFAHKFYESLFFSGWAFVLLGSPLLIAYGIETRASGAYFLLLIPFLLGFLVLPAAAGALACLIIVAVAPQHRRLTLLVLLAIIVGMVALWMRSTSQTTRHIDHLSGKNIKAVFSHLAFTQEAWLPSRWMTDGIMQGAQGRWQIAGLNLFLIWGCGLAIYMLSQLLAHRLYRRAYSGLLSAAGARRKFVHHWSDWMFESLLGWTDRSTRLFVLKDLRTFRRDPMQWAQVLILGGFLLLYFLSIPYMPQGQYVDAARTRIGLLNMAVVGLMLATFTSRFVFPLMSLEGRNFWVLGLLPLDRKRLLLGKFAFASTITLFASCTLTLVSGVMLRLNGWTIFVHFAAMVILSLGLSALSVGLGTCLVNLKETNPSKVATGYGGTINLLLSLVFAVGVVVLAAMATLAPYAVMFLDVDGETRRTLLAIFLTGVMLTMLMLGVLAVVVPLRVGIAAFRRMEF